MMRRKPRKLPPVLAGVLIAAASVAFLRTAQSQAQLTMAEKRTIGRVVNNFRRARRDRQRQAQYIRQAMGYGPTAVSALFSEIEQELRPQLENYRNRFCEQTEIIAKKRMGTVDTEEVARLRQTVLGLQDRPDFSKETIIAHGDPAIKRLAEIFLVAPAEVLTRSKALRSERPKLQDLGVLWQICMVYQHRLSPDDGNKPKQPPAFEKYLQSEEELAVGLAAPMPAEARQILILNTRPSAQLDTEEARGILALNLTRNLLGLTPLRIDLKLSAAARDHSKDMRTLNFFAHDSPVPGKETPWERAKRFGTTASGENIYYGSYDGQAANQAWFHSPLHLKNMLGDHTRVGIGRNGNHFTELFGR